MLRLLRQKVDVTGTGASVSVPVYLRLDSHPNKFVWIEVPLKLTKAMLKPVYDNSGVRQPGTKAKK